MADKNNDKKVFIKENIAKTGRFKRILTRIFILFISGFIFGLSCVGTIFFAAPVLRNRLFNKESEESEQVSIPKDEVDVTEETKEHVISETEPVEDIVQSAIENYKYSSDNINSMYGYLSSMVSGLEDAIVAVHSVKNETDWFDKKVENSGIYSGAVIAYTDMEVIILTSSLAVSDVDDIRIRFNSGQEIDGRLKREDKISGLAVVSVDISALEEGTYTKIKTLTLGNSYQARRGDFIAIVGSPIGILRSVTYGNISYIAKNISATDGSVRLIYTDAKSDYRAGSFVINSSGQLIGIVSNNYNKDSANIPAVGVSDLKSILERMSNAKASAYLGITAIELTDDMLREEKLKEQIPKGLFVKAVDKDSPAYNVGIQPGDIISKIDGKEIKTLVELKNIIENLHVDDNIKIIINRNGRDTYKELEFDVFVGAR